MSQRPARGILLSSFLFIFTVANFSGCSSSGQPNIDQISNDQTQAETPSSEHASPVDLELSDPLSVRIQITAGDTVLYADLYDNPTAASFAELLPLSLNAFDRIGLVKSTQLPQRISDDGERTREYVRGTVFYWPEGPEVAFCYSDHLPETVVDIIHIGLIESGVEAFEEYTGELHVALMDTDIVGND